MTYLLENSILKYLDRFETRENFSMENAFLAMTNHYKDIHMVDFYSKQFPKEEFLLTTDKLWINVNNFFGYPTQHNGTHNTKRKIHYTQFLFSRCFTFKELLDETIEVHLHLYFENTKSEFKTNVSLQKEDLVLNEYVNDEALDEITESEWYQTHKNAVPFMKDLFVNYNL